MSGTIRVVRETVGNVQVSFVEPLGIERIRILGELRSSYLPELRDMRPAVNLFVVSRSNTLGMTWAKQEVERPSEPGVVWLV